MIERTLELPLNTLLPGVDHDDEACLGRLAAAVQQAGGIHRAHLEPEQQPWALCLHFDEARLAPADAARLAQQAAARLAGRYPHATLTVEGIDCTECVRVIEHSLGRRPGVLHARVDYAAETVTVAYDARRTSRGAIFRHLRALGYPVPPEGARRWLAANRELLFSLLAGLWLALGWLGETFFGLPAPAALALYLAAYAFGGWHVARHALHALRERHFDTDLLMAAAALGAAALGQWAEGALLLFLFSLGHALEARALDRARSAVRSLGALAPRSAVARRDGRAQSVPVDELALDEVVLVRPGERLPVDGEVLAGQSAVDQAPVTGESVPVDKAPGDTVYAGTVNGQGALEVRVTRLARDSTLARVMQLVEEAEAKQSPTQRLVERFERVFVPAVLAASLALMVLPPLFGVPWREAFMRAMTLLVAASPCALALGTPAAVLAGIAQAARHGVLIKGGRHLENLGRLRALAFDKTGTLTHGRPAVTDVLALHPAWTPERVLSLAAAVEAHSAHPLAAAVAAAARERGLSVPEAQAVEAVTGRGLRAQVDEQAVRVGSVDWLRAQGVSLEPAVHAQIEAMAAEGKTVMLLAVDGLVAGALAVADTLRPEAAAVAQRLRAAGVPVSVMLTGDNARAAAAIARQAGLTGYRAGLLPEDKAEALAALKAEHGLVGMVGDGVNDAPALAQADVGVAMGGASTAVALETADVALMGDDLSRLPFAIGLGRATRAVIAQNLAIALGVIALLGVAAVTGWAGIGLAIAAHEGSTLVVVANALRLLRYEGQSIS